MRKHSVQVNGLSLEFARLQQCKQVADYPPSALRLKGAVLQSVLQLV